MRVCSEQLIAARAPDYFLYPTYDMLTIFFYILKIKLQTKGRRTKHMDFGSWSNWLNFDMSLCDILNKNVHGYKVRKWTVYEILMIVMNVLRMY